LVPDGTEPAESVCGTPLEIVVFVLNCHPPRMPSIRPLSMFTLFPLPIGSS